MTNTLALDDIQGLMIKPEGGRRSSVTKRRNSIELGLVLFVVTNTPVFDDVQGSNDTAKRSTVRGARRERSGRHDRSEYVSQCYDVRRAVLLCTGDRIVFWYPKVELGTVVTVNILFLLVFYMPRVRERLPEGRVTCRGMNMHVRKLKLEIHYEKQRTGTELTTALS
ncbi:hypothetical protein EVAR_46478_1 [Eumeta japonica]|uniref:Uncharacterized protein n=1 Tax=Eumeta variegata TaxID=151549 RepID=A0A4C1XK05_EUMVA|nr:hypothetical protein EVAR_46478_1 [Eumeta japonica]